jgi:hypothetical protein
LSSFTKEAVHRSFIYKSEVLVEYNSTRVLIVAFI